MAAAPKPYQRSTNANRFISSGGYSDPNQNQFSREDSKNREDEQMMSDGEGEIKRHFKPLVAIRSAVKPKNRAFR